MTLIRNFAGGLVTTLLLTLLFPALASAMVVDAPSGTLINGWYKDSFTINVHWGNGTCTGPGTANLAVYHSSSVYEGSHVYYFMTDSPLFDDPYYSVDGSPPALLGFPPCSTVAGSYSLIKSYTLQLDAQSPTVGITSPSGNTTTSEATYDISGIANDNPGSGVQYVRLYVNGVPGTATSLSANTFTLTASLNVGDNSIQVQAADRVGHTSMSNTVVITRSSGSGTTTGGNTSGSGTSGGTSSGSTSGSSSSSGSSSTGSTPATVASGSSALKFLNGSLITINNGALDKPSDPSVVLAETGFPTVNALLMGILIGLVVLLVALNVLVIWRFRPVFARLDSGNSGLRRRIIIIVTLPSLLPVFGIGFLAYQQLSTSLKAALSQELARAAQTSSIKLEREFAIRSDVITINSSDIFQIKAQFKGQYDQLASQKNACSALIAAGKLSKVSSDDNCLPFLNVLGQLGSASKAQYQTALTEAYTNTLSGLQADERQRTDALLATVRSYFPDTTELVLIDNGSPANTIATLPASGTVHPIITDHASLLTKAQNTTSTLVDLTRKPGQVLFTYPITDTKGALEGQAVVAFNLEYSAFIPAIWQATPKPYAVDKVFFLSSTGQQVYPRTGDQVISDQAKKLTSADVGSLLTINVNRQELATRTASVSGTGWTVAVGAPPSSILAPVANVQRVALLAITSFLLLSLLLGIVFVSGIATEIEALYQGALRFAKNELDYIITLPKHDELRALGDTMNKMANDIKVAQAAVIEKDKEFINITSHELKAPMTAVLGNLSMVIDDGMGVVDQTARELIDQAYVGTKRLKALVMDLLDVARLEAGKAQFNFVMLDITKLTADIIKMQETPARQATISVQYQPPANVPQVRADESKLMIIITNYISNAIKYNRPNGSVTVAHELKDGMLITSVADTGLGIPVDQQAHMFEKFYRVQSPDRANVPGTGLGMYITRRFVEAMGGKAWFTSVQGSGSTFYFSLPVSQPAAPIAKPVTG